MTAPFPGIRALFRPMLACFLLMFTHAQAAEKEDFFSVYELVDECDTLAAHPSDPLRMADGVADENLVPELVALACEAALTTFPEEHRFTFQLARAFLARNEYDLAQPLLEKALKQGYLPAAALLGDIFALGLNVPPDQDLAKSLYETALRGGFADAETRLQGITLDKRLFVAQRIMSDLGTGNLAGLEKTKNDVRVRSYLFSLTSALLETCETALSPHAIPGLYLYRFPGGKIETETNDISADIQAEVGAYDARVFLSRHGCRGPIAKTAFDTLNAFFKS